MRTLPGVRDVIYDLATPCTVARRTAARDAAVQHRISGVDHVIAVESGKGGVGKITVAVNLAVALVPRKERIRVLDADIYGLNVPRMLGVTSLPPLERQRPVL